MVVSRALYKRLQIELRLPRKDKVRARSYFYLKFQTQTRPQPQSQPQPQHQHQPQHQPQPQPQSKPRQSLRLPSPQLKHRRKVKLVADSARPCLRDEARQPASIASASCWQKRWMSKTINGITLMVQHHRASFVVAQVCGPHPTSRRAVPLHPLQAEGARDHSGHPVYLLLKLGQVQRLARRQQQHQRPPHNRQSQLPKSLFLPRCPPHRRQPCCAPLRTRSCATR